MSTDLRESRTALTDLLTGLSDETARRKPAPDRWSVTDCVEHLVIAEHYLFSQVLEARATDAATDGKREQRIRRYGADRTRRMTSPAGAEPAGRFQSLSDAAAAFVEARERTIRYVEGCQDDLRLRVATHPVLGEMNAWEILLTMVMHPHRHAGQIREMLGSR